MVMFLAMFTFSKAWSQTVEREKVSLKQFLNPSALLEWESSFAFEDSDMQKTELIFKPELNIDLNKNVRWVIIGRLYSELTDQLEPGKPDQSEVSDLSRRWIIGNRLEAEMRECYVDIKIKKTFLTVGKQQIVWGKADGLRIMDLVNPFNFREFLLDEFEDSRIPLWAVKADIPVKAVTAQLIWLPDQTYHDLPDPGAVYALGPAFPEDEIVEVASPDKPNRFFRDSDLGLRLSAFLKGWDLTLNYLYMYDDFQVGFQTRSLDGNVPVVKVRPTYIRNHLLGSTFSNAMGSFTLRGEVGYIFDKHLPSADPNHVSGIAETDQLMAVVGLDYSGLSNSTLSTQLFVDKVMTKTPLAGRDDLEGNVTVLISRNFANETLGIDISYVQNLNRGEGFIQAKVNYLLRSNLNIWLGAETIYGNVGTFIGQFRDQDRISVGLELGI